MKSKLLLALLIPVAAFAQITNDTTFNGLTQSMGANGVITRGQIVKINSAGQVTPVLTTDTSGAFGIAVTSIQGSGNILVSIVGSPLVQVDGVCTAGNVVLISSTVSGDGHCSATASGQTIGTAIQAINGPGFIQVQLSPSSSAGGSDPQGGGTPTLPTGLCNGYLVKQGDFLIQNSTGNVGAGNFTLTWRMILATGERKEFQQTGLAGATGNGPNYNSFPLVEGCLVGGSLTLLGGGVDSGQTYAQVFLGRNFAQIPNTSSIQLLGCQISSNYSFGWTGATQGSCRTPTDGQGYNQTITFSNPAAGANLVNGALSGATIIGQKHWLANVRFTLTSNATAQARQVCITFKDASANVYYGSCIQATQAASLIVNYDFTAGVGAQYAGAATLTVIPSTNVAATANEVQGTLPSNLQFSDASTISITVIGIQTGDQLSNIVVRTFWSHHVTD